MNAAATQDVRAIDTVPLLSELLKGSTAPSEQAQQMLDLIVAWKRHGGKDLVQRPPLIRPAVRRRSDGSGSAGP